MNLGLIRSETQTFLMNTQVDPNSFSWPVAELNDYINEAAFYTQQVTEYFQDTANIVCTASVGTYTAPPSAYQFQRLTWDRFFLPQTNYYQLDKDDPSWRLASPNNPFRFYFPQLNQNFQISPYPTPSQNGVDFSPFSSERGTVVEVTADGSTPEVGYTFNQEVGTVIGLTDTNGSLIRFLPDLIVNPFTTLSSDLGDLQLFSTDELNLGLIFTRIPDTMVLDTDFPQLPLECHYPLVFYSLMKCFMREGEFQDIKAAQGWFMVYGDWMESVLEAQKIRWPTRVKSLEPYEEGSLFKKALSAIGYPLQLNLKPSYGA